MSLDVQKLIDGLTKMKRNRYKRASYSSGTDNALLYAEADFIDELRTLVESCVAVPSTEDK